MPTAVISDIHANASALRTALGDIERRGIQRIICLGDVIGYGPDPLECVDLVRERCVWSLMGNHDYGVLYQPTNFNPAAESAAFWSRTQFENETDESLRTQRYAFLGGMRVRVVEPLPSSGNGHAPITPTTPGTPAAGAHPAPSVALCVHASPRRPINEYIFPDDARNDPDKMKAIFDRIDRICLCGHTHVPGVFTDDLEFVSPKQLGESRSYPFEPSEKIIVNVGSIGQPRDHDPRLSYAILHDDRVEFVRLEYDIAATAEKIKGIEDLHDWLGDRLYEGR